MGSDLVAERPLLEARRPRRRVARPKDEAVEFHWTLVECHCLDPDRIRDFARTYTEAWCSHDPAGVADHYTPGGTIEINGGARPP